MIKKYKIIIIGLLVIAAIGAWLIFSENSAKDKEKISFATGFALLDDEKDLIWSEAVKLEAAELNFYQNKVREIQAGLAAAKEKDERLANYNNLAIYQKYLGNYRAAYDAYLESLKLESQARVAWQNFADVLFKIKAYKSAEMAYKKAIDLNIYIPESYVKLADFYQAIEKPASVEATYKTAIETIKKSLSESDVLVLTDYANWLTDNKRYTDAIKILEELVKKQPENKAVLEDRIEELKEKIQ